MLKEHAVKVTLVPVDSLPKRTVKKLTREHTGKRRANEAIVLKKIQEHAQDPDYEGERPEDVAEIQRGRILYQPEDVLLVTDGSEGKKHIVGAIIEAHNEIQMRTSEKALDAEVYPLYTKRLRLPGTGTYALEGDPEKVAGVLFAKKRYGDYSTGTLSEALIRDFTEDTNQRRSHEYTRNAILIKADAAFPEHYPLTREAVKESEE